MKRNNTLKFTLLASLAMLATGATQAATVANGDLMLYFQQLGGNNTAYVNLGSAALLYRGAESGPSAANQALNIINISSTLVSAFGAGWASDTTIYAGLAAVRTASTSGTVVNGDQNRTVYVSKARADVGTLGARNSDAWNLGPGSLTAPAGEIFGLTNNFATNLPNLAQGVVAKTASQIDETNPFLTGSIQGAAFGTFGGGVQQVGSATAFGTFGPAGQVEFALDLNRIVPDGTVSNTEIAGPSGPAPYDLRGTYEGTVVVGSNGSVSFVTVPEPSGTLALGILGTIAGLGYRRRKA